MEWVDAKAIIRNKISISVDVNSPKSSYRIISAIDRKCYKYD
jgi:hypothetical protein